MNALELKIWLENRQASKAFTDLTQNLLDQLPKFADFQKDTWNVHDWLVRNLHGQQKNLYFAKVENQELKTLCKAWVLDRRLKVEIGPGAAEGCIYAAFALSKAILSRPVSTITTSDFYDAEKYLSDTYGSGTAYRRAGFLQALEGWLSRNFGLYLDYNNRLLNPIVYGRYGSEEGRENKLVPDLVIADMLKAQHRDDLIFKDQFYLSVFAIQVATGFRISELVTIPADCLIQEGGYLQLLHYPGKGGKPIPRPIHPDMQEMVLDAVETLQKLTEKGRSLATVQRSEQRLDWRLISQNTTAFRYFVEKWANEWTSKPGHLMINPDGAWYQAGERFVDAIGELKKTSNKSAAARNLGVSRNTFYDLLEAQVAARRGELPPTRNNTLKGKQRESWDTDTRVLSMSKLMNHCEYSEFNHRPGKQVEDVVQEAQTLQLQGEVYPAPPYNEELESQYQRLYSPLIRTKDGTPLLYPHQALLIIEKSALSEAHKTRGVDFQTITQRSFAAWLSGEKRSHGTQNHEDSVFSRLDILDPRVDDIAKFTNHDVRHWLNTLYQNGGLSEDQIALIFNRKHKRQNAVYDHTSNKVRTARLQAAIRENTALGRATETYHKIAEFSRDEAEDYLGAVTRMVNPMPHGICLLDWSTTPCPHHLSCFACESENSGPCEHLEVDARNQQHIDEIHRLEKTADLTITAIELQGVEQSPQLDHFRRVKANVKATLKLIDAIELEVGNDRK